jgi:sulfonate transport system substrate-binding protein
MKKIVSSLSIVWLLVGVFGATFAFSAENYPKVIRIGSSGGAYGKPYIAGTLGIIHAKGLLEEEFKKEGIKFEWNFFKGQGPACNEAFANENIDISENGAFPAVIGVAAGLKTRVILGSGPGRGNQIMIPRDSKITTVQELKGKKIGVIRGTNTEYMFLKTLELHGMSENDLTRLNMQATDTEAALATKDVDAGVVGIRIRDTGVAKVLYSGNPDIKYLAPKKDFPDSFGAVTAVYVTEKFAKKYPDVVKRFVKVYLKAARYVADEKNRTAIFKLWAQAGTPYANIKEQNRTESSYELSRVLIDDFHKAQLQSLLDFAKKKGYVKRTFDVNKWVDTSYQEAALKELKLEDFWARYDKEGNVIKKGTGLAHTAEKH